MEVCLEALLEMYFYTKRSNFGVEAHMEAPAGDALRSPNGRRTLPGQCNAPGTTTDSVQLSIPAQALERHMAAGHLGLVSFQL
jgi:hypothetical protein